MAGFTIHRLPIWGQVVLGALVITLAMLVIMSRIWKVEAESEVEVGESEYLRRRQAMVREQLLPRGIQDPRVIAAMEKVPRHLFIPPEHREYAYDDHPLPIGHGQTISQPFIVAFMTQLLELDGDEKVLEVGTGSGYQAAVLSLLSKEVYTIELDRELGLAAQAILGESGYGNVEVRIGDGYQGWPSHAPFDSIMVTCAPDHLPQPLVDQLAEGGRLVVPMGPAGQTQTLWLYVKHKGDLIRTNQGPVIFVPLRGEHGVEGKP